MKFIACPRVGLVSGVTPLRERWMGILWLVDHVAHSASAGVKLLQPPKFGKPLCCNTPAPQTSTNAEHSKREACDDLDLLSPIAVTSAENTEDPKGTEKQSTNPQYLKCFIKVSSSACLPIYCLFIVDHEAHGAPWVCMACKVSRRHISQESGAG